MLEMRKSEPRWKTMEPVSISDKGFKRGAIDRWTTPYDFPADGLENWVLVDASWEKPENSPPLQRIDMKGDRSLSPGDTGKYELILHQHQLLKVLHGQVVILLFCLLTMSEIILLMLLVRQKLQQRVYQLEKNCLYASLLPILVL